MQNSRLEKNVVETIALASVGMDVEGYWEITGAIPHDTGYFILLQQPDEGSAKIYKVSVEEASLVLAGN